MLPLTFTAAGEATLLKLLQRPIGGHATPRTEPERQRDRAALSQSSENNVCTHTATTHCQHQHYQNTTNTKNTKNTDNTIPTLTTLQTH